MALQVKIPLHPRQKAALYSPAEQTLYGGAAGGGKSYLLRAAAITWCLAIPGFVFYLFRRTYGDLRANHFEGYMNFYEMLAPLVNAGQCVITEKQIRFSTGSKIVLAHLGNPKDLLKYQGRQIHGLGLDEATHFTEEEVRYLFGRMRLGGLKLPKDCPWTFPRAILATNPGGRGHLWAKEWFVENKPFRVIRSSKKNGSKTRVFIPSLLQHNPTMAETDPEYKSSLEGLGDPVLVRAMLDGDWDIAPGAMFGDVFRKHLHVCKPFPIPADWKIWLGADDGYGSPAACYALTQDPNRKTVYVIGEVFGTKMLPEAYAARIKKMCANIMRRRWDGAVNNWVDELNGPENFPGHLDAAAWSDTGNNSIPRGAQLVKAGVRFKPAETWNGSRRHGCQNMHRMLATNPSDPAGRPGLIFFDTCVEAIKRIPIMPKDKDDPEDVDTKCDDHCYDGVRYGLQWIIPKGALMRMGT